MELSDKETLSDELRIAIAHSPANVRPALEAFLSLDQRLARIIAKTTEPILGQMRLAWWRDVLALPRSERPSGDAVLDAIGQHWEGREQSLIELVDGWEVLLTAELLGTEELRQFASGRAAPFAAIGADDARHPGMRWALADAAVQVSSAEERTAIVKQALALPKISGRLPRSLRGLAILDALARRSLECGGRPLLEGRGAAAIAIRVAIFGR